MKTKFIITAFLCLFVSLKVSGQFDGSFTWTDGRTFTVGYYTDKIFYTTSSGNVPSFFFDTPGKDKVNGRTEIYSHGCITSRAHVWYKFRYVFSDDGKEQITRTFNPIPSLVGTITVDFWADKYGRHCGDASHSYGIVQFSGQGDFKIIVEQPQWQGAAEIQQLCSGLDKDYVIADYFNIKEDVKFYLDNDHSNAITVLNPSKLSPGHHTIEAAKAYDNGHANLDGTGSYGTVYFPLDITILPSAQIAIDNYPSTLCVNGNPIILTASPKGGNWSGQGIDASGNFTPSYAAVGRNELTYTFNNDNGCVSQKTIEILVKPAPDVEVEDISVCQSDGPIKLNVGSPTGGTYSGRGIEADGLTFNPAKALVGENKITYTYADPVTGCSSSKDFYITIVSNDNFQVGQDMVSCTTSDEFNLNDRDGIFPNDGSIKWSGDGVVNEKYFSPSQAGIGLHTITGTLYVPTSGCSYKKTFVIKVVEGQPVTAGSNEIVCTNEGDIFLTGATPLGGKWSGDFVENGYFMTTKAPIGTYTIYYTYDDGTCAATAKRIIQVVQAATVNAGQDFTVCEGATPVPVPVASPTGGSWSVVSGDFYDAQTNTVNPEKMQTGENLLIYTYHDPVGCDVKDTVIITKNARPTLNIMRDFMACLNGNPVPLQATPDNGIWEGDGVNTNQGANFYPADAGLGNHNLTYTIKDQATGCMTTDTVVASVTPPPTVTVMGDTSICIEGGILSLKATPSGGTWDGQGVTNDTFDPNQTGTGKFEVTYTYTDPFTKCSSTDKTVITVKGLPGEISVLGDTIACEGETIKLTATADNVSDFNWYVEGQNEPFATGAEINYTVNKNTTLIVQPRLVNPGDCGGKAKIIHIIDNTPTGSIKTVAGDTLQFGGLFQATSAIIGASHYRWVFGDGGYSKEANANHYYYNPGRYAAKLTATSKNGCAATFKLDTIYVANENGKIPDPDFNRGSGYDENTLAARIYPTTFTNMLTLTFTVENAITVTVIFYDQKGNELKQQKITATAGSNKITFDKLGFMKGHGVYFFVKVISKEVKGSFKLFKL